jgi:hypothetical protein
VREKVLDLILWIFKFFLKASFLGGLFFVLFSCSVMKQNSGEESLNSLSKFVSDIRNNSKEVDYGPTQRNSSFFKDVTSLYGLDNLEAVSLNVVDLNRDGFSDLVLLPYYYSRPKFFLFNSKLKKFEILETDPLPEDFKASFLVFHDFNKDGVLDFISVVFNQKSEVSKIPVKLFEGKIEKNRIRFYEKKDIISLPPLPTSSISLIDYDLDGWMDFFLGNWFRSEGQSIVPVSDALFKNSPSGKFDNVSYLLTGELDKSENQIFPPFAKPTYGTSTCDIDQNGYPDILTASSSGHKNKMWLNLLKIESLQRYFKDYGVESNYASDQNGLLLTTGGGRSFFSSCTDYNNDGIMDLFLGELTHGHDNESVDKSSLLTGETLKFPPFFIRTEYVSDGEKEFWNQGDRRATWFDYNLDGRIDLLVDNSGFPPHSRLVLYEQDSNHRFINQARDLGIDIVNPSSTVILDVNQDGRADILTSQTNIRKSEIKSRLYLFENNVLTKNSFLKIFLSGIDSNRDAIGSLVEVELASRNKQHRFQQKRWVDYFQGGLASQNEGQLIIGVPKDYKVTSITVTWPLEKTSKSKMKEVLKVKYKRDFKKNSTITLCENGTILPGKRECLKKD